MPVAQQAPCRGMAAILGALCGKTVAGVHCDKRALALRRDYAGSPDRTRSAELGVIAGFGGCVKPPLN